jgi:bifunctional non-homologous end joining protein LigD
MPPPPSREPLPRFLSPMLASAGTLPRGKAWAAEVKWDGMRAQVRFDGRRLTVRSRPGRDCTEQFPELASLAGQLRGHKVLLDAELVCLAPDGKPDFHRLRSRLVGEGRPSRARTATLMVYDVLHLDDRAVRALPYTRRRELLSELGLDCAVAHTALVCTGVGAVADLLTVTDEHGLEGVVAKRLDAPWAEGRRSAAWVKLKHRRRETFVVTGWRTREGRGEEYLLARRDVNGSLAPAGSVGMGLDAERRAALVETLAVYELPPRHRRRRRGDVRWVAPVVEVAVEAHGRRDGPVRDAVLRDVVNFGV